MGRYFIAAAGIAALTASYAAAAQDHKKLVDRLTECAGQALSKRSATGDVSVGENGRDRVVFTDEYTGFQRGFVVKSSISIALKAREQAEMGSLVVLGVAWPVGAANELSRTVVRDRVDASRRTVLNPVPQDMDPEKSSRAKWVSDDLVRKIHADMKSCMK